MGEEELALAEIIYVDWLRRKNDPLARANGWNLVLRQDWQRVPGVGSIYFS